MLFARAPRLPLLAGSRLARLRLSSAVSLLRSRRATATAKAPTELRSELAGRTPLLALASVTATVAALAIATVAARAAAAAAATLAVTAEHAARGRVRALLLDVRGGDDFGGEVEPLAQVVEALGSEGVVVPLPGELGLEVAAGGEGLAGFDDLWGVG